MPSLCEMLLLWFLLFVFEGSPVRASNHPWNVRIGFMAQTFPHRGPALSMALDQFMNEHPEAKEVFNATWVLSFSGVFDLYLSFLTRWQQCLMLVQLFHKSLIISFWGLRYLKCTSWLRYPYWSLKNWEKCKHLTRNWINALNINWFPQLFTQSLEPCINMNATWWQHSNFFRVFMIKHVLGKLPRQFNEFTWIQAWAEQLVFSCTQNFH